MGFDYGQFGAKRKEFATRNRLAIARIRYSSDGKKLSLSVPISMAEELSARLGASRFDYAMDGDGNVYLFSGSRCKFAKTSDSMTKGISLYLVKEMADKNYARGKVRYLEHEIVHDSNGVPAAVFMPIGG